jgi:hypothetical protein
VSAPEHGWAGSGRYFDATIDHLDLAIEAFLAGLG